MMYECVLHLTKIICRSQKTTSWIFFFYSIAWVSGIEHKPSGLNSQPLPTKTSCRLKSSLIRGKSTRMNLHNKMKKSLIHIKYIVC